MAKHLVLVAGNIGAGKTSLTERIGQRLGWRSGYESVADKPYLSDFYSDMHAWAFHLQVFFLGHRAEQYIDALKDSRSAILDRSIYEDFHIFTRALHHMGNMAERDYLSYRRLFDLVVASLPPPALLVYLKAPAAVLIHDGARPLVSAATIDRSLDALAIIAVIGGVVLNSIQEPVDKAFTSETSVRLGA